MVKTVHQTYSSHLEKVYILVINSSSQVCDMLKELLQHLGFKHVFTALDTVSAVQIMKEMQMHLVIVDWQIKIAPNNYDRSNPVNRNVHDLPLNGTDFVKRLRLSANSPNPFLPIIVLANNITGKDAVEARDSGVNSVVLKPIVAEQLAQSMIDVIDRPRIFVTAPAYKGPCRRRKKAANIASERRKTEVRVVKYYGT